MRARTMYFKLDDNLETNIRLAAWEKAGIKVNGELDGATWLWPEVVRCQYDRIGEMARKLRVRRCLCDKRKDRPLCKPVYREAHRTLNAVGADRREQIASTLALLAHTRRPDDGSAE